jgi:hypothetical protein
MANVLRVGQQSQHMNRRTIIGIAFIFLAIMSFMIGLGLRNRSNSFVFENQYFRVELDSVIRSFKVDGQEYLSTYAMFQCEEDYQLKWKLETFVRQSIAESGNITTVFSFSQLYTYDVLKEFVFYRDRPSFTVKVIKAYQIDAFSDNNQIIVDFVNIGFVNDTRSALFINSNFNLTIDVLSSDPGLSIQDPIETNPTEVQFNFKGKADRDLAYHHKGDVEIATFNVTVVN